MYVYMCVYTCICKDHVWHQDLTAPRRGYNPRVAPVRLGSSITMQVKAMQIGGVLSARCVATGNIFTDGACKVGLSWANRTIAKLKPDIAAKVKDKVNDPKTQADVANGLKKYLTIGQSGEIAITGVKSDAKAVTISFQLNENAGG